MDYRSVTNEIAGSVIAVPPLARTKDMKVSRDENASLVRYLVQNGVNTLLYGGNANFYNMGLYEFAEVTDLLLDIAADNATVIPSAGPEFGRLMDQANILKSRSLSTVMVLPASAVMTQEGTMQAIRTFADKLGKQIVLYIKSENYLSPTNAARLVSDGIVKWIKYAIVRDDAEQDSFLSQLIDEVGTGIIVSGIGELPAVAHMRKFGLPGFTSGSACIAPALSARLLKSLGNADWERATRVQELFIEFEGLRNSINPITVLHEGVRLADVAATGPVLPLLSNLEQKHWDRVGRAAKALKSKNAKAENILN